MLYNIFHEFSFRLFPNFNAKKSKNHWTSLTTFRLLSCKEVHFLYMKNLILISVWSTLTALYQKPTSQHLIRINNTDFTTSFAATSSLHVRAVRETGFLWELLLWVAGGLSSLGLVMSVCLPHLFLYPPLSLPFLSRSLSPSLSPPLSCSASSSSCSSSSLSVCVVGMTPTPSLLENVSPPWKLGSDRLPLSVILSPLLFVSLSAFNPPLSCWELPFLCVPCIISFSLSLYPPSCSHSLSLSLNVSLLTPSQSPSLWFSLSLFFSPSPLFISFPLESLVNAPVLASAAASVCQPLPRCLKSL